MVRDEWAPLCVGWTGSSERAGDDHVSQAISRNATNFWATSASVHDPAPIPPDWIARVCTPSNCRLSRCISDSVTRRTGKCSTSGCPACDAAGGEGTWKVDAEGVALRWAIRLEVILDVVAASTARAFGGGFWRCGRPLDFLSGRKGASTHVGHSSCRRRFRARGDRLPNRIIRRFLIVWDGVQRRVPSDH